MLVRHGAGLTLLAAGSTFVLVPSDGSSDARVCGGKEDEKVIIAAAVSPDGKYAAVSSVDKKLTLVGPDGAVVSSWYVLRPTGQVAAVDAACHSPKCTSVS